MIRVTLIGTGNVSLHLQNVLSKAQEVQLIEVLSSRGDAIATSMKTSESSSENEQPDVYVIAVSDDAIPAVSEQLKATKALIVHTSGSVSIKALPAEVRTGVFYPLQSFSKNRAIDFSTVPICIEAAAKEDLILLKTLAATISNSVYEITSPQRKTLHLAAVFVNNFTNHIYQIGHELCEQNEVSFDILKPLIAETAQKIESLAPIESQTGPAKRNDKTTIEKQLDQLKNKNHKEIYKVLTQSILNTYGEKL